MYCKKICWEYIMREIFLRETEMWRSHRKWVISVSSIIIFEPWILSYSILDKGLHPQIALAIRTNFKYLFTRRIHPLFWMVNYTLNYYNLVFLHYHWWLPSLTNHLSHHPPKLWQHHRGSTTIFEATAIIFA